MTTPTPRIVDFKLPLPALISGVVATGVFMVTLGFQAAIQSSKLDQLIMAQSKMEKRLDERDSRMDALRESVSDLKHTTDMQAMRLTTLERTAK